MALKAELENLKKAVNKFKKDKSGYESSDSSSGGSRKQRGKGKKRDPNWKPFPAELKGAPRPDDPSKPRNIYRRWYLSRVLGSPTTSYRSMTR